uniref:Uncharacterized protein n=1 Tax=Anguilla anguilla TaxID=7936 RepID=A0A0E9UEB7_ANGAN
MPDAKKAEGSLRVLYKYLHRQLNTHPINVFLTEKVNSAPYRLVW